jgi:hypothetical protein
VIAPAGPSPLEDVGHVIQLAIAPVFMLTAVATLINVLSTRLARIVDRVRVLHERIRSKPSRSATVQVELNTLFRRRRRINFAITFAVTSALLVCVLIVAAFVGAIFAWNIGVVLALLFIGAMIALVIALVTFLQEIFIAVGSVEIEAQTETQSLRELPPSSKRE